MLTRAIFSALLAVCALAGEPVRLLRVEPTVLFPRAVPLRQVAMVTFLNDNPQPVSGELVARVQGGESGPSSPTTLPPGVSRHRVLVPDISTPAQVEISFRAGGSVVASSRLGWQPQRKWKVFVVKSSHEDLGYENYIFRKQRDIADFIDLAAELSSHKENLSDLERKSDSRYHYTMESLLFQRNYVEERGLSAWRSLVEKHIRNGDLHLMGAPSGVHSHWMDYEELARMTYPGRRTMKDRYGLDLKTFMIVDNPSLSWSGAQAVASAGFRYVARWGQPWRTGGNNSYKTTKLPALFWWRAPDGEHRVLFGWRSSYGLSFWYGQTGGGYGNLIDLASEQVSLKLKRVEEGEELGPYPYDALVNPEYIDHDTPRFDTRVLPEWASRYTYPEIRIASPTQFFEYIEKQYGAALPELSGDLNNFSADYATIDPESQGWKRRASRLLPLAESVGVLASLMNPGYLLSPASVERTYTRFFDYDEHSWPTLPPASDVQLFNAAWVKKHEARRALDATERAWKQAATAFASNIATGEGQSIAVFNGLAHARTDLVSMTENAAAMTDLSTGKRVPVQRLPDGRRVFLAADVPAFGYKVFRLEQAETPVSHLAPQPGFLANEFYEIRFDETSGAVRSIRDRSTGRELVDAKAPYLLNQMVYVHKDGRESREGFRYTPARARKQESTAGPVAVQHRVWIDDEKTGAAITQTVTLYAGMKRIDIENHLEHTRAMYTPRYEERYRDNIYFAFPFDVRQGQFRVEYPGGVVRPFLDQLRWGSHDYLSANRWVDVSNAEYGVTVAPGNAGTFSFGDIRYNEFSIDYRPQNSHLYSYAWSNRMSGLLTLNAEDANATFRYALTSHAGDWHSGAATQFGWSIGTPLEVIPLQPRNNGPWRMPSRSFFSVSAPNVQLTVLKPSAQPGRGLVARLIETQGKETEAELDLSALDAKRVTLCDLVENDVQPLAVSAQRVKLRIRPFGFATLRLEAEEVTGTAPKLTAEAAGNETVRLSWTRGTAPAWNVYHSTDPQDPALNETLLARVTSPSFTDRGVHPKQRYYYRVAPVTAANMQGPLSDQASVEIRGPNTTPPGPVEELGVVRRSKDRLMVYWRTNTEPDLARYYVFRSERPDFRLDEAQPIASFAPSRYFLQLYSDDGLKAGTTYYYRVVAEDWSGNRQTASSVAFATTPRE